MFATRCVFALKRSIPILKYVYVGNLSYRATEQDVTNAFQKFGQVVCILSSAMFLLFAFPFFFFWLQCTYRQLLGPDGRPRGFGFVVFANDADVDRAIKEMNGVELLGRPLRVNAAMGKASGPGGRGFGGRGEGGRGGRGEAGRGGRGGSNFDW